MAMGKASDGDVISGHIPSLDEGIRGRACRRAATQDASAAISHAAREIPVRIFRGEGGVLLFHRNTYPTAVVPQGRPHRNRLDSGSSSAGGEFDGHSTSTRLAACPSRFGCADRTRMNAGKACSGSKDFSRNDSARNDSAFRAPCVASARRKVCHAVHPLPYDEAARWRSERTERT
jgi:hypothetical protein